MKKNFSIDKIDSYLFFLFYYQKPNITFIWYFILRNPFHPVFSTIFLFLFAPEPFRYRVTHLSSLHYIDMLILKKNLNFILIYSLLNIVFLTFNPDRSVAQGRNILHYSQDYIENTKSDSGEEELKIKEEYISGMIPFKFDSAFFSISANKKTTELDYKGTFLSDYIPEKLYKSGYDVVLGFDIDESRLILKGGRGYASDREELSDEDYATKYLLLYDTDPKGKISWQYGVTHSKGFEQVRYIPILGWKYKSDQLTAKVMLPSRMSFELNLSDNWKAGLNAQLDSGTYRLTEDTPQESAILKIKSVKSRFGLSYRLAGPLWITAFAGHISHRSIEVYDQGGDKIDDLKLRENSFAGFALNVRFD